jgi:hypothetical protein
MRFALFMATLSLATSIAAVVSSAQPSSEEEARVHFQRGVELFHEGRFEQASVAFERAYKLRPHYKILFNVAQVENELGHYAAALEAYTRYLAEGGMEVPEARLKAVKAEVKRLNALVGMVVVSCDIPGATVYVDGRKQGEVPLSGPVFVDLGDHEVRLTKGTDELHEEIVRVGGGEKVTVEVKAAEDAQPGSTVEDEEERVWTWVAFSVGGAAAIGAGITGGLAASKKSSLEDSCADGVCYGDDRGELDATRALATATDVLIAVAAVGVVAGVVLFFVEPRSRDEQKAVVVAPMMSTDMAGVALGGWF